MNVKLLILYGLLVGTVIVLALYFTNTFGLQTAFSSLTSNFVLPQNITQYLSDNWVALSATIAPAGIATVVALVNNARYKAELKAKQELIKLEQDLTFESMNKDANIENQQVTIKTLSERLASLENDTTLEELQKTLSSKLTENQQLTEQLGATNKSLAYVMQQLAQGATTIKDPVTGETIKLVDKIVVK